MNRLHFALLGLVLALFAPPLPAQESISDVFADPRLDFAVPADRARAVNRIRTIENANRARAHSKARAMGIPIRKVLPNGTVTEIMGLDENGELLIYSTRNANAAISSAANLVHSAPYNLDGTGITVGVWDSGDVRNTHQEFGGRVTIKNNFGFNRHATHVAGTIAAAGVRADAKGMAPNSLIDSYHWGSDDSEMIAAGASLPRQEGKITISNHSYGFSRGWNGNRWTGTGTDQNAYASQFGQYSFKAASWDSISYNAPYYLIFHAAGNDNSDNPANGSSVIIGGVTVAYDRTIHPPGDGLYRNTTTNSANGYENIGDQANSKNIMVVGAAIDAVTSGLRDPAKSTLASFSSRGPTDDGRIKPDIVANGVVLTSTVSSGETNYGDSSGTSMASPSAAGSAALLVHLYRNLFPGGDMRASTLKGLILHTATDIGNPGPDYHYGWGLIDTKSAADVIIDHHANPERQRMTEETLTTAVPSQSYLFTWDGVSPIRATLCWTDPAAASTTAHDSRISRLINDLDLKIIAPDGTQHYPFVMPYVGTWTVASMSENATTGVNSTDNVEQVLIANPAQSGQWTVEVTHKGNLTNNQQTYSLLTSGLSAAPLSMEVARGDSPINVGTADGVSGTSVGSGTQLTYTISNVGGGQLELTTPVTISGQQNCSVTVNTQPSSLVDGGESTSLITTVTPAAGGTWSFNISIANNDPEKAPYHWLVTGIAGDGGAVEAPLMIVSGSDGVISNGGTESIPGTEAESGVQLTYTIQNLGNANLSMTTPVTASAVSNCSISVNTQPSSPVAPSGSTALVLTVTPTVAGDWSATVSIANNDADKNPCTWSISGSASKKQATLTLNNLSQSYDGTPRMVTAITSPAGLDYSITYAGETSAPTNAGSYEVIATITDPDFEGITTGTLEVAKASQIITFAPLDPVENDSVPFELTATASSGLPVSFTSSNPSVASISGNIVTPHAVGTTTITASQAGDVNREPAPDIPQTLNVLADGQIAIGGEIAYIDGYYIHTFTQGGSFEIFEGNAINVEVLVVGGGGGGGSSTGFGTAGAGGGGAGGLIYHEAFAASGTLDVVVGGPGARAGTGNTPGNNGGNSTFGSLVALGGGGGSGGNMQGLAGGSGGGSRGDANGGAGQQPGSASGGFGNPGGGWTSGGGDGAGGGGGAGEAASSAPPHDPKVGGPGGLGRQYDISGTLAYYAGGGGGGASGTSDFGFGGPGGGGNGANNDTPANPGNPNTGGGGGGGNNSRVGADGGSGTVIVRYPGSPSAGTYTVTFDPNGGAAPVPTSKDVTFAATYGTLATTTRADYTFIGWFTAASGGTEVTEATTVSTAANHTLFAQWILTPVSVLTDVNTVNIPEGGTETFQVKLSDPPAGNVTVTVSRISGDTDITVQSGNSLIFTTSDWDTYQTVTLAAAIDADAANGTATITCAPSDPGYTAKEVTAIEIDKDTTLTVASGGNGTTSPTGAVIVEKTAATAISATANEGYDFVNWTVTSGSATITNANSASTTATLSEPATVQANFTLKNHTVIYDGNGNDSGTAPVDASSPFGYGSTVPVLGNTGALARVGFSFIGWNTAADGSGTDYVESDSFTIVSDVTLHAKWNNTPTVDAGADQTVYLTDETLWTPAEINTVAWFDAADSGTITQSGGAVSQWDDKSGNNNHAMQVDANRRPTYQPADAMVNSLPSIGSLSTSERIGLITQPMSPKNAYVVTYDRTGTDGTFALYPTLFSGPGGWGAFRVMGHNNAEFIGSSNFNNAGTFKNGSTINTLAVLPMPASVFKFKSTDARSQSYALGYNQGRIDRDWQGFYSEWIFTDGTEDAATEQKIEGYLAHKWGLEGSLPADHPYKDIAPGGLAATATLVGTVSDADGDPLTQLWTKESNPAAVVVFDDDTAVNTNAIFREVGVYTLRLTADDGFGSAFDEVTITVEVPIEGWILTYSGNGNTGGTIPADQEKIHDVDVTLATNSGSLTKTGYTFIGWNTAPDGSGTAYAVGSSYAANASITLHAQWITGTYLTWDANGATAGQTNGAGAWEGANLWWNGTGNQNWVSGASATFGGPNTAGGAVTLAAPTTVENFTFNLFTGTYTLGSTEQTITLNSGIDKPAGSAALTFVSPIALGGDQAWANHSVGTLTTPSGTNFITNNGFQLTVDGTGTTSFGNVASANVTLSGSGALVKNGTGRLNIGGVNSGFTGTVTLNGGVTQVTNNAGALGAGNLTLNGGVLSFYWGTTYSRTLGTGLDQVRIPGGESGVAGAGTDGPTINLGTTVVWGASGEGSATGFFNPSKFVLGDSGTTNAGSTTFSSAIDFNGATRTILVPKGLSSGGNVTIVSGAISSSTGTAGLIKEGEGTLVLSAANTYGGPTTISGGTLRIGNNTAGTLNSGNYSENISIASGATLQIWSSEAQTLSGTISGAGGLDKAYGGALTLSGPNTYTGTTTISAGKLFINGDSSAATDAVSVAANATLGGTGTLGGNTTIAADGRLEFDLSTPTASHDALDLAATRTLTFSGASVLTITSNGGASPGTYTLVTAPGGITGTAPATLNLPIDWVATTGISGNSLVLHVTSTGSGPGPVDYFVISSIASPQTVGSAINGITIAAQDVANETATGFTGTVTFGGTAGITGTSASFVEGVLTGVSVTPAVAGANLTLTVDDGAGHTGSVSFTVDSVFDNWSGGTFENPLTDPAPGADPDGDGLTNLQEFAFGTDPTAGRPGPVSYDQDGNITPGIPVVMPSSEPPVDAPPFEAVFTRRKDYVMAGLEYQVHFSADLVHWFTSPEVPTVVAAGGAGEVEAVSVSFPVSVALGAGGTAPPKFFRVGVASQ